MTSTEHANLHRAALIEIGWACGPVQAQANGEVGFVVTQPAFTRGRGRKAKAHPAQCQVRSFDDVGTMTVTVLS